MCSHIFHVWWQWLPVNKQHWKGRSSICRRWSCNLLHPIVDNSFPLAMLDHHWVLHRQVGFEVDTMIDWPSKMFSRAHSPLLCSYILHQLNYATKIMAQFCIRFDMTTRCIDIIMCKKNYLYHYVVYMLIPISMICQYDFPRFIDPDWSSSSIISRLALAVRSDNASHGLCLGSTQRTTVARLSLRWFGRI